MGTFPLEPGRNTWHGGGWLLENWNLISHLKVRETDPGGAGGFPRMQHLFLGVMAPMVWMVKLGCWGPRLPVEPTQPGTPISESASILASLLCCECPSEQTILRKAGGKTTSDLQKAVCSLALSAMRASSSYSPEKTLKMAATPSTDPVSQNHSI